MLRIAISVEGATEREFVAQVLAPYFLSHNKHITAIDISGNVSLDKIKREIKLLIYSFDYIATLYDFYGFKGRGECTVDELECAILEAVPNEKRHYVIPYIQQYEFEALLFSAPEIMSDHLGDVKKTMQLKNIIVECGSPEAINHGYETCPNRRISKIFSQFDKKLDGPEICKKIGLNAIRLACPRFNNWMIQLENIA